MQLPPISALDSAAMGISQNLNAFEAAARRVVASPLSVSTIQNIADMKLAQHGVAVNVAVARIGNDMTGGLIDLFA